MDFKKLSSWLSPPRPQSQRTLKKRKSLPNNSAEQSQQQQPSQTQEQPPQQFFLRTGMPLCILFTIQFPQVFSTMHLQIHAQRSASKSCPSADEPSSSLGQYFRIFAHFGSCVTLAVTLLSSRWHCCSGEVILLFTFISFLSHLLFCFLLAFFVFRHTVARVTADVTAEVSAEAISTFADLSEISLFCYFLFLFHFIIFGFLWVLFLFSREA